MWIVCKFILLDFRLQVFGFGSAGAGTWPMTTFAVQLLLLWLVASCGSGVWVFPQLQESLVSFLVLPVCENLQSKFSVTNKKEDGEGRWYFEQQ